MFVVCSNVECFAESAMVLPDGMYKKVHVCERTLIEINLPFSMKQSNTIGKIFNLISSEFNHL